MLPVVNVITVIHISNIMIIKHHTTFFFKVNSIFLKIGIFRGNICIGVQIVPTWRNSHEKDVLI